MKTSGLSAFTSLMIGREILGADRIALVVGELEVRVGERRPRRARQVDAEAVGDADHGDGVADLAFVAQLGQQLDQRLAASALVPSSQKLLGQRLASSGARSVTAVAARCG